MSRVSGVSARANPLQLLLLSLSTLSCQSVKCNSSTPSTFVFKRFSAEESAASLGEGKRERGRAPECMLRFLLYAFLIRIAHQVEYTINFTFAHLKCIPAAALEIYTG